MKIRIKIDKLYPSCMDIWFNKKKSDFFIFFSSNKVNIKAKFEVCSQESENNTPDILFDCFYDAILHLKKDYGNFNK
jgi:hypothetical protein